MTSLDTRNVNQPLTESHSRTAPAARAAIPDDFDIRGPIGDIDWTQFANCKGKTHLFFAPKAERPQARARREAKARSLCDKCVVAQTCKEFARVNHEYGLWGGESEEERHLAGFTIAAPVGLRSAKYRQMRNNGVPAVVAMATTDGSVAMIEGDASANA